jgi:CzcA family heavy metal efflux pump
MAPLLEQQGVTYHARLFRQASFIEQAIGNVVHSLLLGAVLVAIVLFAFLFNVRTAFISLTAIPLSLLTAILVLTGFGISLNTLTLGGLAIAVGEVVDDAIIDVENIYRRLRANAALADPFPAAKVVLAASLEVRSAVVYATFIVVLVFLPIFFLTGLQGRLFAPLGYGYVLAVLASLGVALTVTPALSMLLLPKRIAEDSAKDGRSAWAAFRRRVHGWHGKVEAWMFARYESLLRRLNDWLVLVLPVTVLLIAAAVAGLWFSGGAFLPELRESHFVVHMRGLPGTSLPQSLDTGSQVITALHQFPGVRSAMQQAGRAELGEDTWGVEYSEIEVDLHGLSGADVVRLQRNVQTSLSDRYDRSYFFEVMPFLTERIKETISGSQSSVAVKIYGDDFAALDRAAAQVARVLNAVPGKDGKPAAVNVLVEPQVGAPELVVRPRLEDAGRFGLRRGQILDAVHTAYQGAEVGQAHDRNRTIDLVVVLDPQSRGNPQTVADLWLTVPGKPREGATPAEAGRGRVQLKQVADVFLADGRFLIAHEGGLRRQMVSCNVGSNLDVATFVTEAERGVRSLNMPAGVSIIFTGEHEARRSAIRELAFWSVLVGTGILILLGLVFRTPRHLLLLLANLPFALVGGVAAVWLGGGILDVGAIVGFVTLFGITTRNAIMMISHWQHLHDAEGMDWGAELVFRGARERLVPVVMTALVTALGLLPIALGSGEPGREIEGPMAQVILGGLLTSTALNLLVLPVLFRRFGFTESRPTIAA